MHTTSQVVGVLQLIQITQKYTKKKECLRYSLYAMLFLCSILPFANWKCVSMCFVVGRFVCFITIQFGS